jgi:hypothetical protein
MATFTRKHQQQMKKSTQDYSEKCSTRMPLPAYLHWRPIIRNCSRKLQRGRAFGSTGYLSKMQKASQNSSTKNGDLIKRDTYRQPCNSSDCHLPDERSLSVSDTFELSSMGTGTKPIHLRRRTSFQAHRAAISDILKKGLAIFSIYETMNAFSEDCQGIENFSSSISFIRLPNCYSLANPRDLIGLVSDAVINLMDKKPVTAPDKCKLTRFHSKLAPHVSVYEYFERLSQLAEFSSLTLLTTLFYIRKLLNLQPAFLLSSLTVHRLLLSCVAVSVKIHNDYRCSQKVYARAGGVRPDELTILELELLKQLAWDVIPREEYIKNCYLGLIDQSGGYLLLMPEYVS